MSSRRISHERQVDMSDLSMAQGATVGASPLVFEAAGGWCFGWHNPASGARRGVGIVLCRPFGYEAICAYRTYTLLAEGLAQDGFDVLRFDYQGTGDSTGNDTDPDRVQAWLDSIAAAVAELRRVSGVSRITLAGVRLGATLAMRAAAALGGVDNLVLWAPCSGRMFGRELRAASAAREEAAADGDIEALGYRYTAATLQELAALDRQPFAVAPARQALLIGRDDMPLDSTTAAALEKLGVQTTTVGWPGYAAMMVEPHDAVIALDTLASIREWLRSVSPADGTVTALEAAPPASAAAPVDFVVDGVRETAIAFGPGGSLFGIVAEPAATPWTARAETAVLLLSVGANPHIGPNRNYVRCARSLAAAGYRTFRVDMRCIGDSGGVATFSMDTLYHARNSAEDVCAAIDALAQRGCKRFYLMGICSGSYAAFQTALVESRVTGQILMNSRLLDWERGQDESSLEGSMHTYYKSSGWYVRELLNPRVYWRLLRGDVNVSGIGRRFVSLLGARAKRVCHRVLRRPLEEQGLLGKFRRLSARGTDTLVIMAEDDDGRDYLDLHLGTRGALLRGDPNFRMVLVPDADHTFSSTVSQQRVIELVREHLERRMPEPSSGSNEGVFMGGATAVGAG
jgi:pimeloyl-ACP methyl ester carboxylesterase